MFEPNTEADASFNDQHKTLDEICIAIHHYQSWVDHDAYFGLKPSKVNWHDMLLVCYYQDLFETRVAKLLKYGHN